MEDRRGQIIREVHKLYLQYGIKSVTMDDVSRHLVMSKKTLYTYFPNKEELVREVFIAAYESKSLLFREAGKKNLNAVEELFEYSKIIQEIHRDYNPAVDYDLKKYYPSLFSMFREIKRKRVFEFSLSNLNKGKREGLYRRDLNASVLARLHVFRVEHILDSGLFTVEEMTSVKVFHELFFYHLNGVLSEEGRNFLATHGRKFIFPVP